MSNIQLICIRGFYVLILHYYILIIDISAIRERRSL